jgi:protein-tyrosine phosphatase
MCTCICVCVLWPAGGGRTGLVQAAWLVSSKGMSPAQAAEAVTAYAASKGLSRRVDQEALQAFLQSAGVQ